MNRISSTNGLAGRALGGARKIMLYSHDTYGLGHLRRNLRIAGHLLASAPDLRVVLVSGSPVSEYFPALPGLSLVKLPPVRKVGAEQYEAFHGGVDVSLVRRARTAIMADVVRRFLPDIFLVDHSPAGMNRELLDVFRTINECSPATRVVLGLRDILDDPEVVVRNWTDHGIYELLTDVYDQVLVYGQQDVFDVARHYRLTPDIARRLVYAGYIVPALARSPGGDPEASGSPYLLATAGGGGDGAAVLEGAMEAGSALGIPTKVVTGPLIDDAAFATLEARASREPGVELLAFHPNLQSAMAGASALITMGGYNTLCEAISVGVPTVVVPRSHPRLEQTIRAGLFADRGLVSVVTTGPDLADRLARAVNTALSSRTADQPIDFGGLDRVASLLLSAPGRLSATAAHFGTPGRDLLAERLPA